VRLSVSLEIGNSEVSICFSRIGFELERLLFSRNGLYISFEIEISFTEVELRIRVIGFLAQRLFVFVDGLFKLARVEIIIPTLVVLFSRQNALCGVIQSFRTESCIVSSPCFFPGVGSLLTGVGSLLT